MRFANAAALLLLMLAGSATAVIIDATDGSGNTSAPSPDPGWSYVGKRGGSLGAVYLGDGWVLTANHVGAGTTTLGGVPYAAIPGTGVQMHNPDDSLADLLVFAIAGPPIVPLLPIAPVPPGVGDLIYLIGNGRDRGAVTSWNPPGPGGPLFGYQWGPGNSLRWGTNLVEEFPIEPVLENWVFTTDFDETGDDECQAALGDSGGAVFAWRGGQWELAGIMTAVAEYSGQPADTSLYGQITYAADLSVYRDEIVDVVNLPEPQGALSAGLMLLVLLRRRRAGCCTISPRPATNL